MDDALTAAFADWETARQRAQEAQARLAQAITVHARGEGELPRRLVEEALRLQEHADKLLASAVLLLQQRGGT